MLSIDQHKSVKYTFRKCILRRLECMKKNACRAMFVFFSYLSDVGYTALPICFQDEAQPICYIIIMEYN